MDSKNIYISGKRMKSLVIWPLLSDSEWEYFGSDIDTNKEKVRIIIESYFTETDFYVVRHRNNSFECNKASIQKEIENLLGISDFTIWNKSFTKAIEFSKIGVLRRGEIRR